MDKMVDEFSLSLQECHPPIVLTHRKAQGYKHEAYINIYKRLFTPARVN
jgi:hypothetical protein